MHGGERQWRHHPRAAVLLETLVSLAMFVAVAMITLGITGSVLDTLQRDRIRATAHDLAASRYAELSAGVIPIAELRDPRTSLRMVGSVPWGDAEPEDDLAWELRATALRSDLPGHREVVVTARALRGRMVVAEASVRGLMRLADDDADMYEEDDLFDGLPEDDFSAMDDPRAAGGTMR